MKTTLAQADQILKLILQKGISGKRLQQLLESGFLADLLDVDVMNIERNNFRKVLGLRSTEDIYPVIVNYAKSLEQMINAGKYDSVELGATEYDLHLDGSGMQEVSIEFMYFDKPILFKEAVAAMKVRGYRPAKIEELLALGATFPHLQKRFSIVALGSVLEHPRSCNSVACIYYYGSHRKYGISCVQGSWDRHCRFAVVLDN